MSGPGDVTVVQAVYEPGQSSGWHTHAGIHAVVILSGTLTVYDASAGLSTTDPASPTSAGRSCT